ncbi:MAG TPA: hypothetical protein PLN52_12655 [Opitutaceae bacterium]|nr:hypothetical protein [Opitutaceae bacterium]
MSLLATLRRHKLVGVCPPARGAVLDELTRVDPAPVWMVVAPELKIAEQLVEDIALFHKGSGDGREMEVLLFPEAMPETREMREAFAASADRQTVLSKLKGRRSVSVVSSGRSPTLVVVTTPAALLQPVPALEAFAEKEVMLQRGKPQSFQGLLETLRDLDYDSEAVCESPGHYSVRGGIIDVYPITANEPYRLDFFGDEIESIKAFDPVTQRSGAAVESIPLSASPRLKLASSTVGLADYLSPATHLVLVEPAELDEELAAAARGGERGFTALLEKVAALTGVSDLDEASAFLDGDAVEERMWDADSLSHHRSYPDDTLVAQERLQSEVEARHAFLNKLAGWKKLGYGLVFVVSKEGEEQRAKEILEEDRALSGLQPVWWRGALNEGFRITYRDTE